MSSEWQDTTIGAVCSKVFSGGTPTSTNPDYYGGAIPWLRTKEVNYGKVFDTEQHITQLGLVNSSAKLVPINSVIVAMYGNGDTAGRVAINKIPLTTNQACCNLVVDPRKADFRFVYYYLMGRYQELVDLKNGGAQQNLNGQLIKAFPFSAPDVHEQNAIADVFESLDDRITLLRETNATLEAIAQALFKSWFVDFDPVRAKLEGRTSEGMDEATAALFPDGFEESELGLVPRGWKVGTLDNLAEFQNGYAFKSKNWVDAGHPVVKIGDVKPGIIDFSGCSFVAPETTSGLDRFRLKRGDLLVGMTGYVGETGLVAEVEPAAYLNQRVGRITTAIGMQDAGFVYCLVRNADFKTYAEAQSHGSAQANVSGAALLNYASIIPTSNVQSKFNDLMHPILETILSNHEQAQTLATLRDTLLPRLISGQLRLPEIVAELLESNV